MNNWEIRVEKLTGLDLLQKAAGYTRKDGVSTLTLERAYELGHSPIRTQLFLVEMKNIPTYVSTHFVRHHVGISHFVKSNRNTEEVVTRDTPINHAMLLNAEALISIAHKRLCSKADSITRKVMKAIKEQVKLVDGDLSLHLIPICQYRNGLCSEEKSCNMRFEV